MENPEIKNQNFQSFKNSIKKIPKKTAAEILLKVSAPVILWFFANCGEDAAFKNLPRGNSLNNDYSSSETADAGSDSDSVNNENTEKLCGKSDKYLTKETKNLIDQLKKPILQRLSCYTEAYYAGYECAKNTNQTVLKNFQIDDQVCACERQIMENQCDKAFSDNINKISQNKCDTNILTVKRNPVDNTCPSKILEGSLNKGNTDPDHDGLKTIVEFLLRNNICGNTYTCDSSDGNLDKNGNGIPDGQDKDLADSDSEEIQNRLKDPLYLADTYGLF